MGGDAGLADLVNLPGKWTIGRKPGCRSVAQCCFDVPGQAIGRVSRCVALAHGTIPVVDDFARSSQR